MSDAYVTVDPDSAYAKGRLTVHFSPLHFQSFIYIGAGLPRVARRPTCAGRLREVEDRAEMGRADRLGLIRRRTGDALGRGSGCNSLATIL